MRHPGHAIHTHSLFGGKQSPHAGPYMWPEGAVYPANSPLFMKLSAERRIRRSEPEGTVICASVGKYRTDFLASQVPPWRTGRLGSRRVAESPLVPRRAPTRSPGGRVGDMGRDVLGRRPVSRGDPVRSSARLKSRDAHHTEVPTVCCELERVLCPTMCVPQTRVEVSTDALSSPQKVACLVSRQSDSATA